jgi:hypothetical protein
LTKDVSTSFEEPPDFLSAALKLSTEKVEVLDEVSQGGRTIAGPSWTITDTVKVILVVYTSIEKVSLVVDTS